MSVNTAHSGRVKEEPEQASWECAVSVRCERVKQEDERCELYAGHTVKRELVLGPERLQPQDLAFALARARARPRAAPARHREDSVDGLEEDLRRDNETLMQSGIEASDLSGAPDYTTLESSTSPTGGPRLFDICLEQLVLKVCFVKLERMLDRKQAQPHETCKKTSIQKLNCITHTPSHSEEANDVHSKRNIYCCDICGNNMRKSHLIEHFQTHMDLKQSASSVCKDSLEGKHEPLGQGKHQHQQPALKVCTVQLERFFVEKKLYACCNTCHKVFGHQSSLKSHLHSHAQVPACLPDQKSLANRKNVKSYICDACNKQCTRKADLVIHIRIHTGEKPFSCDICMKKFTINGNLQKHMKIHTGDKDYTCNICNRKFTLKSNLQKHVSLHRGHKPHTCKTCKKQFAQRCHLKNHVRFHMKDKSYFSYSCDICGKKFAYTTLSRKYREKINNTQTVC